MDPRIIRQNTLYSYCELMVYYRDHRYGYPLATCRVLMSAGKKADSPEMARAHSAISAEQVSQKYQPADMTSEPAFHASAAGPTGLRPLIMGEANRGQRRPSFKCTHGEELEAASHRCSHAVSGRSGGPRHQPPACASSNPHRCGHSRRCRSRLDRGFGLYTRLRIVQVYNHRTQLTRTGSQDPGWP